MKYIIKNHSHINKMSRRKINLPLLLIPGLVLITLSFTPEVKGENKTVTASPVKEERPDRKKPSPPVKAKNNEKTTDDSSDTDTSLNTESSDQKYTKFIGLFGITYGNPGGINLTMQFYGENFGLGITTSLLTFLNGENDDKKSDIPSNSTNDEKEDPVSFYAFQLNANFPVVKSKLFLFSPTLFSGFTYYTDNEKTEDNWKFYYTGIGIHVKVWYFFIEAGISGGKDFSYNKDNYYTNWGNERIVLTPVFQAGIVLHLN